MIILNDSYYVYTHINKVNGKIYVGVSKRKNPNDRWKNGKGYDYNLHFSNAIKKYGWDNFDHEIVASNLTKEEASNMETILITKLNTIDNRYGYNLAEGGYNNRGLKGDLNPFWKKRPEKAIEASVKARIGKPLSDETKEKIRQGNKKKPKNINSIKALNEHCHDKRPSMRGAGNHKSVPVQCIETGIIYESQLIAEQEMNLPRGSVYQAIKNNIRAKGYHFVLV